MNRPQTRPATPATPPVRPETEERRAHPRKTLSMPVDYIHEEAYRTGTLKNISEGGVFLETENPLKTGDLITLFISHPDFVPPFQIPARVVRKTAKGVGAAFTDLPPERGQVLKYLVENLESD